MAASISPPKYSDCKSAICSCMLILPSNASPPVRSVRRARNAGRDCWFKNTVSVSLAFTSAAFQLSCTGDSEQDTIRVPICTPSAPMANAPAIDKPSEIPPAAIMGMSTRERINGNKTIVETGLGFLKPPPSPPSTINPSTPASMAFSAMSSVGTT